MDNAALVRRRENVRDFCGHAQRFLHLHRPAGHESAQRLSLDELHRDVGDGFGAADVVDRNDVRMIERRRRARLLLEPPQRLGTGHIGRKNLQRDVAIEFRVARAIDLSHAPGADRRENAIRPNQVSRFKCQGVLLRISEALWISGAMRSTNAVKPWSPSGISMNFDPAASFPLACHDLQTLSTRWKAIVSSLRPMKIVTGTGGGSRSTSTRDICSKNAR